MIRRIVAGVLMAVAVAAAGRAQVVQPNVWGTDGEVHSIASVGSTVYIAGDFSMVGPVTGGAVPIDRDSGAPLPRYPRVNGIVHAVISDGQGGWFMGGDFTAVEGVPHHNVAHLRGDGSVDPWDPHVGDVSYVITSGNVNPVHTVSALALIGDVLYIGGRFDSVGVEPHHAIAAVNATTGAVSPWNPHIDGMVMALAAGPDTLYVGGAFTRAAGQPRVALAAFRLSDDSLAAWNPNADGAVRAIALARGMAWIGGEFDHVGGQPRNSLAAVRLDTGEVTAWDAELRPLRQYIAHGDYIWPYVSSIVVRGRTLFAGGDFDVAGHAPRHTVAELDLVTARATSFDAHVGAGLMKTLALHDHTLYLGGYLYDIGGQARPNLGAVDTRTGLATAWDPRPNGIALALAVDGDVVYAGGEFTGVHDWVPRAGLAALDASTGRALPWNPTLDVPYFVTLAASGDRVFAAGRFGRVDGQPRASFAAFDGATGALTDWNPWTTDVTSLDPSSIRLATIDDVLYVAAHVDQFNGTPRSRLFALDGTTDAVLPWDPESRGRYQSGDITAMSTIGGTVFVTGEFDTIGGAPRQGVAQLDGITGLATAWNPISDRSSQSFSFSRSIVSDGTTVFVGGWYYPHHYGLMGFDASGHIAPWVPTLDTEYEELSVGIEPTARALAAHAGTLFVGGNFDTIATVWRPQLAAIDAATGALRPWEPDMRGGFADPFDAVDVLTLDGDVLYVGGRFFRIGGYPASCFAALQLAAPRPTRQMPDGVAAVPSPAFALTPNPARGRMQATFTLPAAAVVTLQVFDISGRRVASWLDRRAQSAGPHTLSLDPSRLGPGVYFGRLEAGRLRATRRFVVLD